MTGSDITAAGHAAMIGAFALLVVRLYQLTGAIYARRLMLRSHEGCVLRATMFLLVLIAGERFYYWVARMLEPLGINLWAAHPAPLLMALLIVAATWRVAWLIGRSLRPGRSAIRVEIVTITLPPVLTLAWAGLYG